MPTFPLKRFALSALLCSALVACSNSDKNRLQGERIDALQGISTYSPSPKLANTDVIIPTATPITTWAVDGQNNQNAIGNMAFNGSVKHRWKTSVSGADDNTRLVAPVADATNLYLMDGDHAIVAINQKTGKTLWEFEPTIPDGDDDSFGGGLALSNGRVLVATPYGKLYALDSTSGQLLWEKDGFLPLAGGATVVGNTGFVPNIDNTLLAFDTTTGEILWRHVGFRNTSALFGVSPPAYANGLLFAGYSNGELYAIRATDGITAWSEGLSSILTKEGLDTIAHVRGLPIIDNNAVFAISHSGRMLALDIASGRLIWDKNMGSANTPWLAGNMLYTTTIEGSIIAVHTSNGLVNWRTPIARFEDEKDKEDAIAWSAPVMANGQLWVVNSLGEVITLNPKDGTITATHKLGGKLYIAPMVVNDTLYIVANDGTIHALGKQ